MRRWHNSFIPTSRRPLWGFMKTIGIAAASIGLALVASSAAMADNTVKGAVPGVVPRDAVSAPQTYTGPTTVNHGLNKAGPGALATTPATVQPGGGSPQDAPVNTSHSNKKHGLPISGVQPAR
jgi:hypothetical protein